ncbi:FG-GAP-like repeat-containing protein [Streptomyces sp. NPDC004059]
MQTVVPRFSFRRALRRALIAGLLVLIPVLAPSAPAHSGARAVVHAAPVASTSPPESSFFSTVQVDSGATVGAPAVGDNAGHGDLWPNCWSDDDNVYGAYGDGIGFGTTPSDVGTARISGTPGNLTGIQLASGDAVAKLWEPNTDNYTRKPTGMACVGGTIYLAVQDLAKDFNDAPRASIVKSTDHGRTWTWDSSGPMFDGGVFTTIFFLDYGKGYANAPDSTYLYAYGLDGNWRDSFDDRVADPADLYFARVPRDQVQDRSAWQWVSGFDASGNPTWSSDINQKASVLHDDRHIYQNVYTAGRARNLSVISQGGVVYDIPLNRYIYTSWSEYTFEFYEAPTPWGPWKHFETKDFGGYPWTHTKHGGYATTIPSKYISADGKSVWLQSNVCTCGGGYPDGDNWAYTFSLRQMHLEPYTASSPTNGVDGSRNLAREPGTVGIERATHYGNTQYYNDGNRSQSDDDWNDENKSQSWWGYTWPREYTLNKVVYTTGNMFSDGGWFKDLRVQVRRNHTWQDVSGIRFSPSYPYDSTAGPNHTYTIGFNPVSGDGVRIIGTPGGAKTFTSIAELEVYSGAAAGSLLAGSPADFDGDGKDDIATFTQNDAADVYVAKSTGSAFSGTGDAAKWHDFFSVRGETPLSGDFNGDGKDDAVTFGHGSSGDVYVALSSGTQFGDGKGATKWHDFFAPGDEIPAVGDFDGDGKDDIVTFSRNANADVYVALSTGSQFGDGKTAGKWDTGFSLAGEYPAVGDVNGDGKDDIITFTQGANADVYVALSTGSSFGPSVKWHDSFSLPGEQPRVADFNGDGNADIATFTPAGDVYVALSTGTQFGDGKTAAKWQTGFATAGQFPYVGDFNGDGKADIVTFTHDAAADVNVALSNGSSFGTEQKWHDYFGVAGETSF